MPCSSARTDWRKRRPPLRHLDRAARVGDGGERMRQDDAGIGEQPAPVAGVVAALAQVDDQVELDSRRARRETASAGRARCAARRMRSGRSARERAVLVRSQSSRRPGEPISSPISIRSLTLKPSRPRSASTAASAAMLIAVLAFVVGGAAAVDALALDGRASTAPGPARQSVVEAAHGVAMAVDQHGERARGPRCARPSGTAGLCPADCSRCRWSNPSGASARLDLAAQIRA